MTVQLIALDIDGTLFNDQGRVTQKTKDALRIAAERGTKIALVSGRPTEGLKPIAQALEIPLEHIYLIGTNGSRIVYAKDDQVILNQTMPLDWAKDFIRHVKQFPVTFMMTHEQTLVSETQDGYKVQHEAFENGLEVRAVDKLEENLYFSPYKILVAAEPETLGKLEKEISSPFIERFDFVYSSPFYYDVIQKNIKAALCTY